MNTISFIILGIIVVILCICIGLILNAVISKSDDNPAPPTPESKFAWVQIGQSIEGEALGDQNGWSVSLSSDGTVMAMSAPKNSDQLGNVRVFKYNGDGILGTWTQIGQDIDGTNPPSQSGNSVSLNQDGTVVAISSIDGVDIQVYDLEESSPGSFVWTPRTPITNTIPDINLSLNGNGNIVVIGSTDYINLNGIIRVYEWKEAITGSGNFAWVQIGQDIVGNQNFVMYGSSVSINAIGNIIAMGGPGIDESYGAGIVYKLSNLGVWEQLGQSMKGKDQGDRLGYSISLNTDGTVVSIGSILSNNNYGNIIVYELTEPSPGVFTWTVVGEAIYGTNQYSQSGWATSLNGNGTIVTASGLSNLYKGSTNVYRWMETESGSGLAWTQLGQSIIGDTLETPSGYATSINKTGNIIAISSLAILPENSNLTKGVVKVYKYISL